MKRENKAYSFKEQIIELELKEVSARRVTCGVAAKPGGLSLVTFLTSCILFPGVILRPVHTLLTLPPVPGSPTNGGAQ